MTYFEACEIYQEFDVGIQYAELQKKTHVEILEEYSKKYGTEKIKEAVKTLRKQQDDEHEGHLKLLRLVQNINSGGNKMIDDLLNLLVMDINGRLRYCKNSLETEEKSKEVACLQGKIAGYKTLINYLCDEFELSQSMVEDNGDSAPVLADSSAGYIKKLSAQLQAIETDARWEKLVGRVEEHTLQAKAFLLFEAENARDMFFTQAAHEGITVYENVFNNILDAEKSRAAELPFEDGETGVEDEYA
jgi:hypothetical protein